LIRLSLDPAPPALAALPEPPHDQLLEARLCLTVQAADAAGDHDRAARLRQPLAPAANELAGGATGLPSFCPIAGFLELGQPSSIMPGGSVGE
jgi:hypothetical protein